MKICSSILSAARRRFVFTSFPGAISKALRKGTLLLFSVGVLAGGAAAPRLCAGDAFPSELDGFDPNVRL
jgi:hypothetical protein